MLEILCEEDYLNYRLIMEGFYYDAAIEHIIEIVKNNLYFAVLQGENEKVIKNTHDTYYFNTDEELLYINYYYDFGPLNISCLYKYCCKLNNYLQYSQGLKRIVHYTSANPIKRVNAAFLIGCYTIIYLKMDPKEVYRTLLTSGGPFKSYVDASQGISQYNIQILDCFYAIQKAIIFNFINFDDFNVNDYDFHDKLQNGDMNWLLPRKFLAFIGPTDSEIMNGHSPDFYVRYFLNNDVKTVVRLNNKLYNASVFTNAGIEHQDLFFPDGSVPSKQILLRFLDLCENARAAIAVHCKAGLGRTGSLIGAYIIKHYRLTAREAIAWMRICRPGSVIGQQQGWLEKIENWLWRQGSHYRLQHFGEGDKIPHHKYGIYSFQWPKERERIIRQVQRRKLATQSTFARVRSGIENTRRENNPPVLKNPVRSAVTPKRATMKASSYIQKPTLEKNEENRKISKLMDKIQTNTQNKICENNRFSEVKQMHQVQDPKLLNAQYQEEMLTNAMKLKQNSNIVRYKKNFVYEEENHKCAQMPCGNKVSAYEHYNSAGRTNNFSDDTRDVKMSTKKAKRGDQNESREQVGSTNLNNRIGRHFNEDVGTTQGDRLNAIKAERFTASGNKEGSLNKVKQVKPRRQLTNVTNMVMYDKSRPSTSKKQEMETILPIKRSHFEKPLYQSRA